MISKLDGARRQLETAIDLFFDDGDSLSMHTLAYAALKVLFDLYPHHCEDGFDAQLNDILGKEGWSLISSTANFLKHADRDPDAFLHDHHPMQAMAVIGFAVLVYREVAEEFTLKMRAFDFWTEEEGYEELGVLEIDENANRAKEFKSRRDYIRSLPHDAKMAFARKHYRSFMENYEEVTLEVDTARASGKSATDLLDELYTVAHTNRLG